MSLSNQDIANFNRLSRGAPDELTASTHMLAHQHHGKIYRCTHADGCAVTIPAGLPPGTLATFIQGDADDAVTFAAGAGATVRVYGDFAAETRGQWAEASVLILDDGSALVGGILADAS